MEFTIDCKTRPSGSKPNALRRDGLLPAVLYGHNGTESVSLVLETKAAETLVKKAAKKTIEVSIPELSWKGNAVIQEVQAHPWRGDLYHLSFLAVS